MTIHRLIPRRMPQENEQAVVGIVTGCGDGPASGCPNGRPNWHRDVDSGVGFIGNAGSHLSPRDEPPYIERPMRGCRWARLILLGTPRPGRLDRHGAHGGAEVGVAYDVAATARGRGGRFHAQHLAQLLVVRFGAIQRRREPLYATILRAQAGDLAFQSGDAGGVSGDRSRERKEPHDRHGNSPGAPLPGCETPPRNAVLFGFEIAVSVDDDRDAARGHPSNGAPRISSSRRARSSFE